MTSLTKDESIAEFYREFDITMGVDLFDYLFIYDSLHIIISPSFPTANDLEDWVFNNMTRLRKELS